jgi:biopolymer transport protein ExbD
MAASTSNDDDMIAGINVTPMVDIVLVLLVIFMVTARVLVSPALAMNVPPAAHSAEVQSPLSIEIAAGGQVLVSGARVADDAAVIAAAKAARAKDPEVRALIRADGSVPHARVIRAVDLLKEAGVTRTAFGVAPGTAASPLVGVVAP